MSMAGRLPYEEVVIDGDTSSDDDDAVVVVTPAQSRKRRRQSAIHDDDDEGAASQSSQAYVQPPPPSGGPHAPTNNSRGTTSGTDSIDQEDEEDDEVEIIQISTPSSAEAKHRKLTVVDSDEEEQGTTRSSPGVAHRVNALQLEPVPRLAASSSASTATPRATRDSEATSTGRRSTRIERKREEKARAGPSARKLEFLSLENCLDPLSSSSRRAAADEETEEDDDDDFIVNDEDEEREEEEDEVSSRRRQQQTRRPRARSPPPRGFTTADDEDLDEFIVADDEVEYMDDDEEGVMDEHLSSADELNEEEDADGHALRMTMQSREPSEWFAIYLRYLEECILDDDLDDKIRLSRRNPEYRLFEQAIHHIERAICSRRDTLRSSVVWNDDIMDHLHCATKFHSTRCTATTDCQACRRANHFATQLVQFGGFSCDSTELYRTNWMKKLRSAVRDLAPMRATFELGTVCHARTLGYWQLLHAKHFWVALVDAKRQECGDGHGRIAESERIAFHKVEYGRYKRLVNLVDKFSTEATKSVSFMPNVWKKVNAHHVHSEFLPSPALRGSSKGGVRRGTLDSLVGDSDGNDDDGETEDEEEEEEEEREEELEEKPLYPAPQHPPTTSQREEDNDDAVDAQAKSSSRKRMRQSTLFPTSSTNGARVLPSKDAKNDSPTAVDSTPATKPVKPLNEIEAEDLVCLVCRQNQRDGAIAHGNYLHFYSCYRCAKRQHTAKQGCMVCDRPIQNVLRILPLSKESRADILKQQQAP